MVAPLVGAWIEMDDTNQALSLLLSSLPLWERGLKFVRILGTDISIIVAPLVGAWIEMVETPLSPETIAVAPLVGAWIEIMAAPARFAELARRSPCGSVD